MEGFRKTATIRGTARVRDGLASLTLHYRLTASRTCSAYNTNVRDFLVRLNRFPFPARLLDLMDAAGPAGGGTRSASQLPVHHMLPAASRHFSYRQLQSSGVLPAAVLIVHRTSVVPPDTAALHRELKTKNALPIISVPVNRLDRPRLLGSLLLRSRSIHCN